ncbi:hypothetical protein EV356DRAFT_534596 [Viridothelium virens]|uniref:Cyclin-dependent protein kinase regulator pho80 n=1 Tax=Viridothelium virens TaxID=1048519 RepID=A0A6A6H3K9_VIRVR|nr:hypothetical protein EV356DRAFT_534596 [Viridothelium virens]
MRLLSALFILSALPSALAASTSTKEDVKVYAWPMSESKPQILAEITYDPQSLTASTKKYHQLQSTSSEDLVRVGLYDPKTTDWTGVVTSGSQFESDYAKTIVLHLDHEGRPFHVGFSASVPSEDKKSGEKIIQGFDSLKVVLKPPVQGPQPHLNKPVVLNPDGKVDEKEPEKTFLQKYWWVLALFLVLQVVSATGGGEK